MSQYYRSAKTLLRDNAFSEIAPYSNLQLKAVHNLGLDPSMSSSVQLIRTDGTVDLISSLSNTDQERGAAFQTAIADHSAGDAIVLGGGTHLVSTHSELKAGVTLKGNGSTTLKLDNQGSASFAGNTPIIFGVSAARTDRVRIRDIDFDCNLAGQSASNACVGAVLIYGGSASEISGCRAFNWGTKSATVECFIFAMDNYAGTGKAYGSVIKDCFIGAPAAVTHGAGGTSAFAFNGGGASVNTPDDGWFYNPRIIGCGASDIVVGTTSGKPYSFNLLGLGDVQGGGLFDNYLTNISDTGGAGNANGLYLDSGGSLRSIIMRGNNFGFTGGANCKGVNLIPINGLVLNNLLFANNIIAMTDGYGFVFQPATGGGVINSQIIGNRVFESAAGNSHGVFLTNTTNISANDNIMDVDTTFTNNSGNTAFTHARNITAAGASVDS